jgi:hypothetical protein
MAAIDRSLQSSILGSVPALGLGHTTAEQLVGGGLGAQSGQILMAQQPVLIGGAMALQFVVVAAVVVIEHLPGRFSPLLLFDRR